MSDLTNLEIAWFDLGLSRGKQVEQERIIKLLEAERWKLPNGLTAGGEVYLPVEEAIALIKGEQKCLAHDEGKFDGGCNCKGEQR